MPNPRRQIISTFKKRGLSLSPKALNALLSILKHEETGQSTETLHRILDEIKGRLMNSNSTSLVVSLDLMEAVVADMSRDGRDVMEEAMQLLDLSSEPPKLQFDLMNRRFSLVSPQKDNQNRGSERDQGNQSRSSSLLDINSNYFGSSDDKVNMLMQRYALIHQRLMRNEHFKPRLVQSDSDNVRKITPIEGLLGSSGDKILLGIIVQVEEGQYYLEDPTAQIHMDLSMAELVSDGYMTEHSICLVEGAMVDGVLAVKKIGHPIYESRSDAIAAIGLQNSDIFGAIPTITELARLKDEEEKNWSEGLFVILSDVHLDDSIVLEKLELLFQGYHEFEVLPVFIFMGDFASRYPSAVIDNANTTTAGYFDELGTIICKYPRLAEEGRFILVPGQNDPGVGSVLPRPKIPDFFTHGLRSKVRHVHMTSNPCRLRYFSKEILIGRVDVLTKLRRNSILSPDISLKMDKDSHVIEEKKRDAEKEGTNPHVKHAIKTMMDQGHLCPVPSSSLPIYWNYDHLLRLYPPPSAVILGDKSAERYFETYGDDCDFLNPGPFYADHGFLFFRPVDLETKSKMKSDVEFSFV